MLGKLRQGVGGTYFINVRQVLEKLAIHQTTIMLKSDQIFFEMEAKLGHQCDLCSFNMNDDSLSIFEELEILEDSIPNSVKETLVYIAGYVAFKTDAKSSEDTFIYYERFGKFTNELSRGKLRIPKDTLCQFTFFACVIRRSENTSLPHILGKCSQMSDRLLSF